MTTDFGARRRALMLAASAVDATALGLYLASAALFLVKVFGMSTTSTGLVLGVGGAASMLGAVPIARLTERFPAARVLTMLFLVRGGVFVLLAWCTTALAAVAVITVGGLLNRGIAPIIQAVALEGVDERGQVRVLAANRALRNVGLAAGGLPIGFVLASGSPTGFRLMLTIAGVLATAAAILAWWLPPSAAHTPATSRPGPVQPGFVALTALYGALTMAHIVLGLGVPLLIVQSDGVPSWTVGLVQVLNTALVVSLQVRASRGSSVPAVARRQMAVAGLIAAVGCLLMSRLEGAGGAGAVVLIVAVIVVLTVAELLVSAGGSGLMLTHIPPGQRARYLAVFNLGFGGASIVGPPLVGAAAAHPQAGSYALAAGFLVLAVLATHATAGPDHPPAT